MIECDVINSKDFDLVVNLESQQFRNSTSSSLFDQWINFMCMICSAEDELHNDAKINKIRALLHMLWYCEEKHLDFDPLRWLSLWDELLQATSAEESWFSTRNLSTLFASLNVSCLIAFLNWFTRCCYRYVECNVLVLMIIISIVHVMNVNYCTEFAR